MWDFLKQGSTHLVLAISTGILLCFEKGALQYLAIIFKFDPLVLHLIEIVAEMVLCSMFIIESFGFILVYYKQSDLHKELKGLFDYILNLGKK